MKTNLSRNTLIGLAFVVSLVMIYFGINFLKGVNIFQKQNDYIAVFRDVLGLNVSSPVYVNGYQIGLVNSIDMINENPLEFGVQIRLDRDFRVKKGSRLEFGADLLGGSSCKLIINESATEYLSRGDTLTGGRSAGMMDGVARVVPRADTILMHIDSVVLSLNDIMRNPAWQQSVTGIGETVNSLKFASNQLNTVLGTLKTDLPGISQNLNVVSSDLKDVSEKLNSMDVKKTFESIDETVANLKLLSDKINTPDNSLGKLVNGTELHDSLNVTVNMATKLLEDIRQNPEKYLSIKLRLF
ncbi:MAG: MlaD family protein [Petrimonas sp.]|nr:MlaD family protein [Petrimonas sp.]